MLQVGEIADIDGHFTPKSNMNSMMLDPWTCRQTSYSHFIEGHHSELC